MAHQTGNASDAGALLNLFATFIGTLPGWTVRRNAVGSGNELRTVVVQRGADEVWGMMARNDQWIGSELATGWDSGQPWNSQPGSSTTRWCGPNAAPIFGYNFFGGPNHACMVIEPTAGQYRHLQTGVLIKAGTYTGGGFLATTEVSTSQSGPSHAWPWDDHSYNNASRTIVRATTTGATKYYEASQQLAAADRLLTSVRNDWHLGGLISRGINLFAGNTTLNPIRPAAGAATGGFYMPLGQVPEIRMCNLELASPGETIPIGSDDWMVFPVVVRAQTLSYPENSGMNGIAYRKFA